MTRAASAPGAGRAAPLSMTRTTRPSADRPKAVRSTPRSHGSRPVSDEAPRALDADALLLFAQKGLEAGPGAPQIGIANAVKVRRVMQLTRDLAGQPFDTLRILDLGCGEGVYAIEAALRGAEVLALDARTQRMALGAACAARHDVRGVRFVQEDVRRVTRAAHGTFDVVYLLGLLYHLDAPDLFSVLEQVAEVCARLLVVDTLISPDGEEAVAWRDRTYRGRRHREHDDQDPDELRRARVLRSIDNTWSFRLTRASLLGVLQDVGFTSVLECHVPFEPGKAADRVTVAALKGTPVLVSTYPWINAASESRDRASTRRRDGARSSRPARIRRPVTAPLVAVFCMPEVSHLRRLLAVVAGLTRRDVAVTVYTDARFQEPVERVGGRFVDLFARYPVEAADATSRPVPCRYVSFAGHYAEALMEEMAQLRPSLIVYDTFAMIGFVLGRGLGIPYVNVCAGHDMSPAHAIARLEHDSRLALSEAGRRAIDRLRDRWGVLDASPHSYMTSVSPFLNLYCEPEVFLSQDARQALEPIAFFGSLPPAAMRLDGDGGAWGRPGPRGAPGLRVVRIRGLALLRRRGASARSRPSPRRSPPPVTRGRSSASAATHCRRSSARASGSPGSTSRTTSISGACYRAPRSS